jgi:phenylacetyl-CoA:acceptor oxidoreductase 26-kDa subunit
MNLGPTLQTKWDVRAVGNWVGGGTGTGVIISAAVLTLSGIDSCRFSLIGIILVAGGLFSVALEIGRPFRSLNVFRNPFTSWMSREAWVALLVLPFGAAAFWYQSEILLLLAAVAAGLYLYCQARILKASRGIPAWRVAEIIPLIIATGLIEGAGLVLICGIVFSSLSYHPATPAFLIMVLVLLAIRALAWRKYFHVLRNNAPVGTVEALQKVNLPYFLLGDLLPMLLILTALLADRFVAVLTLNAFALMLAAGWLIKFIIVTKAGYYQGYAMVHTPARGAGEPGPGTKPGWIQKNRTPS